MKFFRTFLASLLGTLAGLFLLFIIMFAVLLSSSGESEPYVRSNTVLTINISGDIPARASVDPFEELFSSSPNPRFSLETLKNNLVKAAADDNISAVWVKTNMVTASWANLESAYNYFEEYRKSGKPLYFSTDDIGMNEKSYFLATLADSIFTPPATNFEFDGFVGQFTFYRPMLEKIGIEPEIFRVGKYKSAIEPFTNVESSPESIEQMTLILTQASDLFINAVARRLDRSPEEVHDMLNTPPVERLQYALEHNLIDAFAYEDEVEMHIKNRIGVDEEDDMRTINFGRYNRVSNSRAGVDLPKSDNKIAVIYSSGMILPEMAQSPFSTSSGITPENVQKQFERALDDDNVKAIVLHIDSPGGSATSSDLIWNTIRKASEEMPVIASMGSVAASGGYYMAAAADTIVASNNTITGSIGIFSVLFNAQELLNDKIGIRNQTIKTHHYADLFDLTRPFTEAEETILQQNIESGYELFLARVAEGRNMRRDEVHEHAQGRVFTGADAYDVGLVDVIGDLDKAIIIAAEMAEVEEYNLEVFPKSTDFFEMIFSSANARIRASVQGWIPQELNQTKSAQNIMELLNQPAGHNWVLLPGYFDVY